MTSSRRRARWRPVALAAAALTVVACGPRVEAPPPEAAPAEAAPAEAEPAEAEPADAVPGGPAGDREPVDAATEARSPTSEPPAPAPTDADRSAPREVTETGWAPFAAVDDVVLHLPAAHVERVGFHESNHAGARQLEVLAGAVAPLTLESRDRGTGSRSAADVVVDPAGALRAPVTGTVLRSGTYVLYCDQADDYVVIAPDARPEWEVKLLHIDGVQVVAGDRVEAGVTVLAPRPTPLPFDSQVDEHTAEPSWPHVHVEVVDPSIPNPPSGGSC